jgi:hypothetical protein
MLCDEPDDVKKFDNVGAAAEVLQNLDLPADFLHLDGLEDLHYASVVVHHVDAFEDLAILATANFAHDFIILLVAEGARKLEDEAKAMPAVAPAKTIPRLQAGWGSPPVDDERFVVPVFPRSVHVDIRVHAGSAWGPHRKSEGLRADFRRLQTLSVPVPYMVISKRTGFDRALEFNNNIWIAACRLAENIVTSNERIRIAETSPPRPSGPNQDCAHAPTALRRRRHAAKAPYYYATAI